MNEDGDKVDHFGEKSKNDNGNRQIELCREYELIITKESNSKIIT